MAAYPPPTDVELREGLADAEEDMRQAEYHANPCEQTARALLRARSTERRTSLDHDREVAARFGLTL
jgi:hypothetical protein